MAADLEEWNDERSKWKVGRLLQSSVEFFGTQLRILRATTTARVDRSPCQMELLPVTNRCNRRHLTLTPAGIPSVTSGPRPLSLLALTPLASRASANRPTDRRTALQRREQPNGQLGRLSSIVSTGKKKHMRRPSRRRRRSAKPTHTD